MRMSLTIISLDFHNSVHKRAEYCELLMQFTANVIYYKTQKNNALHH